MNRSDLLLLLRQVDNAWPSELAGASFANSAERLIIAPKNKPLRLRATVPLSDDRTDRQARLDRIVWIFAGMALGKRSISAGSLLSTIWWFDLPEMPTEFLRLCDSVGQRIAQTIRLSR